ncbi:MAG TPA: aspartate aminotransferase family protein [Bacillales bacterium]|nr:aspartate aminotransferase family protein [Bacillales bacterium]
MIESAMSKEKILAVLEQYQSGDLDPHGGHVWAYVYDSGLRDAEEAAHQAYRMFANQNGLDFTVFPSLLRLENEVIDMAASMFAHGEDVAGTFTSGGTESIMLAVKAARDFAREQNPEVSRPEIILPETAHAAFHKAAHFLDMEAVNVPVNPETFRVEPDEVEKRISANTVMIVASSVNYSHGVSDPVVELGEIALRHDLWLHVDACIGGFLLYYFRKLGEPVQEFDFSVAGVRSMSVDLHKYAYTPKGASVVLYRDKEFRRFQFYSHTGWTGYPVINTTIQSTKSGGPLAACWATMKYIGEHGYLELSEKVLHARRQLVHGLRQFSDLRIEGEPEAGLVAVASKTVDLFQAADEMRFKGWYLQVQPGRPGIAPTLHFTVTPVSGGRVEELLRDLAETIETVKKNPRKPVSEAVPQMFGGTDLSGETLSQLLSAAGIENGRLPDKMADINELLRVLPNEFTEKIFIQITNELFMPERRG